MRSLLRFRRQESAARKKMMITRYDHSRKIQILLFSASLLISACTATGPTTAARDRLDYVNAMSESWKRQMLLNLVAIHSGRGRPSDATPQCVTGTCGSG
jgi:hypothetical protein